ncbi:AraC family transcriptional regulator [Streptomyces mutabilis]|uniref:AraC family transcriptional regulator n=2 Tax=Streptomyces mutabilis TaxID=67332 RepID=A0A086MUT7_9ACTN|nr:AraC family transcriptional regulator [Streptomyces mutabilis]
MEGTRHRAVVSSGLVRAVPGIGRSGMLNASVVAPPEREDAIRRALWESFSRVDIDHHTSQVDIAARMALGTVGPMKVCSAQGTPVSLRRTQRLASEDHEPAVFLGLQVTGTNLVGQHGRQCLVGPGSLVVFESTAPYTLRFEQSFGYLSLRIPREALALPERMLRKVAAVTLGPGNPTAPLAFTYFSQLAASEELRAGTYAESVVGPSVELLRAVVTSQLGDTAPAGAASDELLGLRITQYVRAHLADSGLSAPRIAAAHGISVRHLYNVLSRSGISLGDWIRSRRLAECRQELAGPYGRVHTIAGIGRRWGFMDATHFSKAFKQAYGMSPRVWRDLHHRTPSHR